MEMPSIALSSLMAATLDASCPSPSQFLQILQIARKPGDSPCCKVVMQGMLPLRHAPSTRILAQNLFTQMCSPIANRDGVGKLTACANLFTCRSVSIHGGEP